jgi:hypothetical protein
VPYFYKINKEHRLVISTGAGVLTKTEILGLQDRLLADSEFVERRVQLSNHMELGLSPSAAPSFLFIP